MVKTLQFLGKISGEKLSPWGSWTPMYLVLFLFILLGFVEYTVFIKFGKFMLLFLQNFFSYLLSALKGHIALLDIVLYGSEELLISVFFFSVFCFG